MGLDITAYRKAVLVEAVALETMKGSNWEHPKYDDDVHEYVCSNKDFEERADDMKDGFYLVGKAEGEQYRFRAGSYSGYNAWRNDLSRMGLKMTAMDLFNSDTTEGPFFELVCFADNEGIIGPRTSAKLAKDFKEFDEEAKGYGTYFYETYTDFRRAFELASGEGFVDFH